MIGLVIVSHSPKIAEGLKELAEQMSQSRVKVMAAGGVDDETIGTNAERIHEALTALAEQEGILVMIDLGSAVMSTQVAIEMLDTDMQEKVIISEAPLVEGTIVAVVEASMGRSLEEVKTAALKARTMDKLL